MLYLDDSGKIHPNDPAQVVVFGGLSLDENDWHKLVRQINGAKASFFPRKGSSPGNPHTWEIKSSDFLTANNWKRKIKRQFCAELANILRQNKCHVYAVSIDKRKAKPPLDESVYVPLAFQRICKVFFDEMKQANATGCVVCDWSTHSLDRHITNCVSSMIATHAMNELRGGVTYGDSSALPPLQLADLVARTFRITIEGSPRLSSLEQDFRKLSIPPSAPVFPFGSIIKVF